MGEPSGKISTDPWNMAEIVPLAGMVGKPGEDAEDPGRALSGENCIGFGESFGVETGVTERPDSASRLPISVLGVMPMRVTVTVPASRRRDVVPVRLSVELKVVLTASG